MNHDLEERLLALEREVWQLPDISSLARRLAAAEQALAASWSTAGAPPPPSGRVFAFPDVCPAGIPAVLTLHDTYYGDTILNWDGVSNWVGCKSVSYPGTSLCVAATTPITYTLFGDDTTSVWNLQVSWVGIRDRLGNVCPSGVATCATKPNQARSSGNTFRCTGVTSWSLTGGAQGQIYPSSTSPIQSITIP